MEASVVVCSALRPPRPCHPENTQTSRDGQGKAHVRCTHGAMHVLFSESTGLLCFGAAILLSMFVLYVSTAP